MFYDYGYYPVHHPGFGFPARDHRFCPRASEPVGDPSGRFSVRMVGAGLDRRLYLVAFRGALLVRLGAAAQRTLVTFVF
jgi:hypothetical protein